MQVRKLNRSRQGFTLIEMMVAMIVGAILIMGMGTVMVLLFTGMRESRDFADATGRVDLVRQLTFDARTGDNIIFPGEPDFLGGETYAANPPQGDYVFGGNEGDQVRFNSLAYDPIGDTTSDVTVTWESRRPAGSPVGTMYTVFRFKDDTPLTPGDDVQTFGQGNITSFEIERTTVDSFSASFETTENDETVAVQLAVTLRNVIN